MDHQYKRRCGLRDHLPRKHTCQKYQDNDWHVTLQLTPEMCAALLVLNRYVFVFWFLKKKRHERHIARVKENQITGKPQLCCWVWSFCKYIDSADTNSFETTVLLTLCGTDGTAPCSPPHRAIAGPLLSHHWAAVWALSSLSAVAWPLAGPEDPTPAIRRHSKQTVLLYYQHSHLVQKEKTLNSDWERPGDSGSLWVLFNSVSSNFQQSATVSWTSNKELRFCHKSGVWHYSNMELLRDKHS